MNIFPVNLNSFKGKDYYDDEISSSKRDAIREHMLGDVFLRSDTFKENIRLEEYGLKKLISKLTKKGNIQKNELRSIDTSIMEKLPLYNVEPIAGTTSYRGGVADLNYEICQKLKEAGVKEVVSFLSANINEHVCKRAGLGYYNFPIGLSIWNNAPFKSEEDILSDGNFSFYSNGSGREKDKPKYISNYMKMWEINKRLYIDIFINFINEMKKDNLYVGCACGTGRTDEALTLNYFFNPKAQKTKPIKNVVAINHNEIKNLYLNLTKEEKIKLGWDKEFDENFIPKLQKWVKEAEF